MDGLKKETRRLGMKGGWFLEIKGGWKEETPKEKTQVTYVTKNEEQAEPLWVKVTVALQQGHLNAAEKKMIKLVSDAFEAGKVNETQACAMLKGII